MIKPEIPKNEGERLRELASYEILDTLSEEDYDNLTEIASEICDAPISLISLIDSNRQWFKSHHGLDITETPREHAFCAHAINDPKDILVVQDSRKDDRFKDNPLVTGEPHVVFYAGVPLTTKNGLPLGTLCVIDEKPRVLNAKQIHSLKALANQVMKLLDLRKTNNLLEKSMLNLKESNQDLEDFAHTAAHDIKSPLKNIEALIKLMTDQYGSTLPNGCRDILEMITNSSSKLKSLVSGLLEYSKNSKVIAESKSTIDLRSMVDDIKGLLHYDTTCTIELKTDLDTIYTNRIALEQIFLNLVSNAIKYNDKEAVHVEIGVSEIDSFYNLYVQDNGPGIPPEHREKVFEIFNVLTAKDRYGESGNGIGLASVKKLVTELGGSIQVDPDAGEGARFIFTLKK